MPAVHDNQQTVLAALGLRLKLRRVELGLTQEGVGHRCGIDKSYIGAIERGEHNVQLATLVTIAEALEWTVSDLTHGIDTTIE